MVKTICSECKEYEYPLLKFVQFLDIYWTTTKILQCVPCKDMTSISLPIISDVGLSFA